MTGCIKPVPGLVAGLFCVLVVPLLSACGGEQAATATQPPLLPPGPAKKCVVLLHGKGGGAGAASVTGDIEYLRPGGNGEGWGGREWRYFPDDRYAQVQATVAGTLEAAGCGRAIVQGFSNGAAAAAKLYCRGETFGGRVIGYIVDDPVTDSGVLGCQPASGTLVRLYWTGALTAAAGGKSCAELDWTCEGGRLLGIQRHASELGTPAAPSIHTTHAEYAAPPEVQAWLP